MAMSDWVYNTFGVHTGEYADEDYYDYGKDVERGVATALGGARKKQYQAMSDKISHDFGKARQKALRAAERSGFEKSGQTTERLADAYYGEESAKTRAYAELLGQEQQFQDKKYQMDRRLEAQLDMQARQEAIGKQQQWLGLVGDVAGTVAVLAFL